MPNDQLQKRWKDRTNEKIDARLQEAVVPPKSEQRWHFSGGMLFLCVFQACLTLVCLEIATGQLISPRPWWLGLKEGPYCLFCSDNIEAEVQRAYRGRYGLAAPNAYDALPISERIKLRNEVILATEDFDAFWDRNVGWALTILFGLMAYVFANFVIETE